MITETNTNTKEENWDIVIEPENSLISLNLKEVWKYRDLLLLFVRRDFVAQYKQTILGPAWFVIQPIITTLMFTVIFGKVANLSTDGLPQVLFYMSGVVMWSYFAECLTKTSETFSANANIFGKVYFPRLVVPLSIVISSLLKLGVQLMLLAFVFAYFAVNGMKISINSYFLLLPLLILLMAGLGLGLGVLISSLTTKYRDLRFLMQFGVQLAMYASPVVYPLSLVEGSKFELLIKVNPMTAIIEFFRYGLLGNGTADLNLLLYCTVFTIILLLTGIIVFNKMERSFMDTV
jgi:lipopolysaccharide transport system permease protein